MSGTLITSPHPLAPRVRPNRLVAAGLAVVVAAGGAAITLPGDGSIAPAKPTAAPGTAPIYGDPPVVKGARGGKTDPVTLRVFGDPTIRKGAGGR